MVDTRLKTNRFNHLRTEKARRDSVALVALAGLAVSGISLVLQLFLLVAYLGIANKPAPSLVQLTDGQSIKVGTMGNKERSPQVIQRFVTDSLILMMSWNNQLPPQSDAQGNPKPTQDPGMEVSQKAGNRRITTAAFQASFTFAEDFRQEVVRLIADMTPNDVFNGQVQTALIFQAVTVPEEVAPGRWKISVVGHLVKTTIGTGETERIPFNKELMVQAIDTPPLPAGGKFANPFEAAIYTIRQAGLEIIVMKDLDGGASVGSVDPKKPTKPSQKSHDSNPR